MLSGKPRGESAGGGGRRRGGGEQAVGRVSSTHPERQGQAQKENWLHFILTGD